MLMKKINKNENIITPYGIGAIIKNKNNEILMMKHNKFNLWTIPIGKVDINEDIEDGVIRELFEELSIKAQRMQELATGNVTYKKDYGNLDVKIYIFEILKYKGEIKNKEPHKHSELKWMTLDEIKKISKHSDATKIYLSYLKKKSLQMILKNIKSLLEHL